MKIFISSTLLCILLLLSGQALADSCSSLSDQKSCTANTSCTYTPGKGDACKNKCESVVSSSDCSDNSNCVAVDQQCQAKSCSGSTEGDCTTNTPYCSFTPATSASCSPTSALNQYCAALIAQPDCDSDAKCSYNLSNQCLPKPNYCTVNIGFSCTNSSECTFNFGMAAQCTNQGGVFCSHYNSDQTSCQNISSCTYIPFSCSNNELYACTGKEDQTTCNSDAKFCTYALPPGTCALTNPTPSNPNPPTETTTNASTTQTNSILLTLCGCILAITLLI